MSFEPMTRCGVCTRWLHSWATHCPNCESAATRQFYEEKSQELVESLSANPTPMELVCPNCGTQHVDQGEWETRHHKTHQCQTCQHEWRPFEYATVGVAPAQEDL